MPKATVTIDLPDGWELADTKMRKAKPGEYRWLPTVGKPYRLESASEGECFIVRRIAEQYVNVKLPRAYAEGRAKHCGLHRTFIQTCDTAQFQDCRVRIAYAEALSERCPGYYHANRELAGTCDRGFDYHEYAHKDGTEDFPCNLPAGHAGEHGV